MGVQCDRNRLNSKRDIICLKARPRDNFFFFFFGFWDSFFYYRHRHVNYGKSLEDVHALPNRETASPIAVKILGPRWERGLLAYRVRVRGALPGKY